MGECLHFSIHAVMAIGACLKAMPYLRVELGILSLSFLQLFQSQICLTLHILFIFLKSCFEAWRF